MYVSLFHKLARNCACLCTDERKIKKGTFVVRVLAYTTCCCLLPSTAAFFGWYEATFHPSQKFSHMTTINTPEHNPKSKHEPLLHHHTLSTLPYGNQSDISHPGLIVYSHLFGKLCLFLGQTLVFLGFVFRGWFLRWVPGTQECGPSNACHKDNIKLMTYGYELEIKQLDGNPKDPLCFLSVPKAISNALIRLFHCQSLQQPHGSMIQTVRKPRPIYELFVA